jgi:Fe2+ or Zn2+ uptake regulation protein
LAIKTWKPRPIDLAVVEILEDKGQTTDIELFNSLKETYEGFGFNTLNQILMRLEIEGKIHMSSLTRGKRRVETLKRREAKP